MVAGTQYFERCPLCGSREAKSQQNAEAASYDCATCGPFRLSLELAVHKDMQGADLRPYLSAATRKAFEKSKKPLFLMLENCRQLEEEQRSIRVSAKLDD